MSKKPVAKTKAPAANSGKAARTKKEPGGAAVAPKPAKAAKRPAADAEPEIRPAADGSQTANGNRITVRNVNVPGYTTQVDATMYQAMHRALFKVLPKRAPGLTQAEMFQAVLPHLPPELFPGGAKAGWWAKTVQLDQEAQGKIVRDATKPLRWRQA